MAPWELGLTNCTHPNQTRSGGFFIAKTKARRSPRLTLPRPHKKTPA